MVDVMDVSSIKSHKANIHGTGTTWFFCGEAGCKWMDGWMDRMDGWMDGWMDGSIVCVRWVTAQGHRADRSWSGVGWRRS